MHSTDAYTRNGEHNGIFYPSGRLEWARNLDKNVNDTTFSIYLGGTKIENIASDKLFEFRLKNTQPQSQVNEVFKESLWNVFVSNNELTTKDDNRPGFELISHVFALNQTCGLM